MNYSKRGANVYDPTQKAGVNYFKHVSKVLMVPTGPHRSTDPRKMTVVDMRVVDETSYSSVGGSQLLI